ncbi:MAG: thiamine pyrophosphate-dependent dehydrogenase E1 component subunit alpha [Sphaerochaetaceae bacterium]|nr:thiamine pyrophosphate-dependent dehydrogenase E1 component subunit alpha [Sphaerochaetaceae bacterium]
MRDKDKAFCLDALRLMLNSRYFEEKTEELFKAGLIHGTTHLANGQEACQAGLCLALDDQDWIVPTHRCHGFTICKGSDPFAMFSEMFGSSHGLAKGLGGSMHMPDKKACNLGSSAVVGSGVPLATGIAFYFKRKGINNISVAIFGDGATSRGSVHESMNLASVWSLPVLFFCENNLYGMSASSSDMISIERISDRAASYSMPGVTVDGNNILEVYEACKKAVDYIKDGKGPYFIEALTYRTKGHSKSDRRLYRTAEEEAFWAEKDPIKNFESYLVKEGIFTEEEIKETEEKCRQGIEACAENALSKASDCLTEEEAMNLVYAGDET